MGEKLSVEVFMAMDLGNTKVQLVAAQEGFQDEELFVPEDVFSEAGAFVDIASNSTRTAHGMLGGEVDPDIAIDRIDVDSLDALVIAGGRGAMRFLWANPDLISKVREADKKGKIIGAIGLSVVVLAEAGILKGNRATVFPDPLALAELKRHEVICEDVGAVEGTRIITARDASYSKLFAEAILDLIKLRLAPAGKTI